jgi:hypothetical protein
MRSRMIWFFAVAALIASVSVVLAGSSQLNVPRYDDSISGKWEGVFSVQNTSTPFTLELQVNGDKVTGTVESGHTGPGKVTKGSWVDNKLSFTAVFDAHESIAMTALLKDGKLIGEFRTEGFTSRWEATKKK